MMLDMAGMNSMIMKTIPMSARGAWIFSVEEPALPSSSES